MKVICNQCGNDFERPLKEVNRINKLGRKMFCSRSCSGKAMQGNNRNPQGNTSVLNSHNRKDKYTGLRDHLRRIKTRHKEVNISIEYLYDLWHSQKGICPFTKWQLELGSNKGPKSASLDRIDNSKGYVEGNVRFVSVMINYAKNGFNEEQLHEFITALRR